MHPYIHAANRPDDIAAVFEPSGRTISYGELNSESNRIAHLFRSLGLGAGDCIALFLENEPAFFTATWAAQRSGLYYVGISTRLSVSEVAYILADSGSRCILASPSLVSNALEAASRAGGVRVFSTGPTDDAGAAASLAKAVSALPETPVGSESSGADMLYSSGTTGRPKGIKRPLTGLPIDAPNTQTEMGVELYRMDRFTVYLSPAPLYHAAPLRWCMAVMKLGGRVVVMEKYDSENALRLIERHGVTHGQFVPTHFVRLLRLADDVRSRHDLSSLKAVFHAAAPCPVPVKDEMMRWWGPIIHEYYSGTESFGLTTIGPQEWLSHKGSVGRTRNGVIRICDENDEPVPPGTEGVVFFADGPQVHYHNAPEKDREATNRHGWKTFGDVGWVDADGFLYLTDRRDFMILSGGVNIYPQEAENALVAHPCVADAAVIGVPNSDLGEEAKAVVQLVNGVAASEQLAADLMAFVRQQLGPIKSPRSVDFVEELPRQPTGKLFKRLLRDRYREAAARRKEISETGQWP